MLTLHHCPHSRSTRIIALLAEMGIAKQVEIHRVTVRRQDGGGGIDPTNPHPEGKVPILDHDGALISETAAIINYLTELFPKTGFAPERGDARRGEYLTWLHWYGAVMEPVVIFTAAELAHPFLATTFRGIPEVSARLSKALAAQPYLLGESYSAADLLVHSPYARFRDLTPQDPKVSDWLARCMARPSASYAAEFDAKLVAALP